jgi:ketol-acid reductoisomerase
MNENKNDTPFLLQQREKEASLAIEKTGAELREKLHLKKN